MKHDHGFLERYESQLVSTESGSELKSVRTGEIDPSKMREPDFDDHLSKSWWKMKLAGAEALRWDLWDATKRYRHFLAGSGEQLDFDYGDYLAEDPAGQLMEEGSHAEMQARAIAANHAPGAGCEPTELKLQAQFNPMVYPHTENWQKAIGGHNVTMQGAAKAFLTPEGEMVSSEANYLAEDMYNFRPGSTDLETRIPDSDNGRFEQTGLAKEFLQIGTHDSQNTRLVAPLLPPKAGEDSG